MQIENSPNHNRGEGELFAMKIDYHWLIIWAGPGRNLGRRFRESKYYRNLRGVSYRENPMGPYLLRHRYGTI